MSLKSGLSSFLVFCIVLLLIFKNYEIWTESIEGVPEQIAEKKSESKPPAISTMGPEKDLTSIERYMSIAEKNIFSPERQDFPTPMAETKRRTVRPQIVLYGVTIAGDYQVASIVNPGRSLHKDERETFTVKVGERIGEYRLARILPDRIAMEAADDAYEVMLYDPKIPKKRMEPKTEAKPMTITKVQTASASSAPGPTALGPPPMSPDAVKPTPRPESVQEKVSASSLPTPSRSTSAPPYSPYRRGSRTLDSREGVAQGLVQFQRKTPN